MTMQEIRDTLVPKGRRKSIIFRPCGSLSFIEVDAKLTHSAFDQIMQAVNSIQMGMTEPKDHAAEVLLLQLLQQHAEVWG